VRPKTRVTSCGWARNAKIRKKRDTPLRSGHENPPCFLVATAIVNTSATSSYLYHNNSKMVFSLLNNRKFDKKSTYWAFGMRNQARSREKGESRANSAPRRCSLSSSRSELMTDVAYFVMLCCVWCRNGSEHCRAHQRTYAERSSS